MVGDNDRTMAAATKRTYEGEAKTNGFLYAVTSTSTKKFYTLLTQQICSDFTSKYSYYSYVFVRVQNQ
jgi:hypothetical protein